MIYEIKHILPSRRAPRLTGKNLVRTLFIDGRRLVPGSSIKVSEESAIINAPTLDRYARLGLITMYRRDDKADISEPNELVSGDMLLDMWSKKRTEKEVKEVEAARELEVKTPEISSVVKEEVETKPEKEEIPKEEIPKEEIVPEETTEAVIVLEKEEDIPSETDEEVVDEPIEELIEEDKSTEEPVEESPPEVPTKKELKSMKKDDLFAVAESLSLEVDDSMTRKELIKAIGKVAKHGTD